MPIRIQDTRGTKGYNSTSPTQPSLLLAAVIEDNIPRVRALLSDRDNIDSALVEAHLLRRTNVIPILKEESQLKENDVIKKVLKVSVIFT